MKKIKSKKYWEYTKRLEVSTPFGYQKVPMCEFVAYADSVVQDSLDFVICFDKLQEDWGFTNDIGIYGMQEVVGLLSEPDFGDYEWKAATVAQLEAWLEMLKEK